LAQVLSACLFAWAAGSLAQRDDEASENAGQVSLSSSDSGSAGPVAVPDRSALLEHLRVTRTEMSLECVMLGRAIPGSSKYRVLSAGELAGLLPPELTPVPGT
jgi:hypothetical protein